MEKTPLSKQDYNRLGSAVFQAAGDAGLTPASDCLVRIDSALAEAVALSPAFGKRLVVNVRLELKKMRPLFVSSFIVSLSYRF